LDPVIFVQFTCVGKIDEHSKKNLAVYERKDKDLIDAPKKKKKISGAFIKPRVESSVLVEVNWVEKIGLSRIFHDCLIGWEG